MKNSKIKLNRELATWQIEAREYYNSKFYSINSKFYMYPSIPHNINYVDQVWNDALNLIEEEDDEVGYNLELLFMCVYCSDLFYNEDRRFHHILAANYVVNNSDLFLDRFSPAERSVIARAIFEHRSNSKQPISSYYSRVLRFANKGVPTLDKIIKRIIKVYESKNYEIGLMAQDLEGHLITKFYENGYIDNDKEYLEKYQLEIGVLRKQIRSMSILDYKRKIKEILKG